jgi:hypothetical protein
MDEAYTPSAMTRDDARVLFSRFTSPAEPASQLLRLVRFECSDRLSFFEFLLIKLFCCLTHVLAGEVLDSEFDSA